jgi:hypothetical protein
MLRARMPVRPPNTRSAQHSSPFGLSATRLCLFAAGVLFLLYNMSAYSALLTTTNTPRVLTLPSQSRLAAQRRQTRLAATETPVSASSTVSDSAPSESKSTLPDGAPSEAEATILAVAAPVRAASGGYVRFPSAAPTPSMVAMQARLLQKRSTATGLLGGRSCVPGNFREDAVQRDHGMRVRSRPLNLIVPSTEAAFSRCPERLATLCAALPAVAIERQLIVVVASGADLSELSAFATAASSASVADQVLVVALDDAVVDAAKQLAVGAVWRPASDGVEARSGLQAKYHYGAEVLSAGGGIVLADLGVRLRTDPLSMVHGDADVEAPGPSGGQMMVAMDFVMGWSQMCETYQSTHMT